jgi:hypothetical protein
VGGGHNPIVQKGLTTFFWDSEFQDKLLRHRHQG